MLSLDLFEASNIDSSSKFTAALLFHGPYCVDDLEVIGKFATLHSLEDTTLNHFSMFCSDLFFPFFAVWAIDSGFANTNELQVMGYHEAI